MIGRYVRMPLTDAMEVDAQHPLPVPISGLVDRPAGADTRVVADDLHAAEVVANAAGHVLDLASIAHMADYRGRDGRWKRTQPVPYRDFV